MTDRQKEIDAFNELKRRGHLRNQEICSEFISSGVYTRRIADLQDGDALRAVVDSVLAKKSKAKIATPAPSPSPT